MSERGRGRGRSRPRGSGRGVSRGGGRGGGRGRHYQDDQDDGANRGPAPAIPIPLPTSEIAAMVNDNYVNSDSKDDDFEDLTEGLEIENEGEPNAENDEEDNIEPLQRRRLKDKLVHDIETAQDPSNYDPYIQPVQVKVVIQKRTRDQEEVSVTWTNQ